MISKLWERLRREHKTAGLAKERLQIIISHERTQCENPEYLINLQRELLEVIAKYVKVNQEDVKVELERKDNYSILELNVTLPNLPATQREF